MQNATVSTVLVFLLCSALPAQAQQPPVRSDARPGGPAVQITGRVLDSGTGTPIGSATISIWTPDQEELITGTITDAEGLFRIERLRPGQYAVRASFVGYATQIIEDLAVQSGREVDLGTLRLQPDEAALGEVEVTAERDPVQFAIDRTIFNVGEQPLSTGTPASEVLQQVPEVEVDIDGNVSLRGSQNVAIHIDGRPAPVRGEFLASFLEQLSADMIERIEVLPNPSARYEPDGMAGIINIVLREDTEIGLSGGVTVSASTRDRYSASGNLGYQRGGLTLFGNYGLRLDTRENFGFNFREERFHQPTTFLEQSSYGINESTSHMLSTRLGYALSPRDEFSAQATYNTRGGTNEGGNTYMALDPNRTMTSQYERLREAASDGTNTSLRLSYDRRIERSVHELTADLRFSRNVNTNEDAFVQQYLTPTGEPAEEEPVRQLNDLESGTSQVEARIDYLRPVGEEWKLELGYRGSLRAMTNDFQAQSYDYMSEGFVVDPSLTNAFDYEEVLHAVYGQLGRQLGSFDLQAGLRLEQAFTTFSLTTTGEHFENNYLSFFPTAHAVYRLTDRHRLRASYSKRVQRPRTRQLNPFTSQDDPLHIFVGNPYLRPEYTHSFEVGYQQFGSWGSLSVTPFLRHTTNATRRIRTVDDNGVATTTFENVATANSYGISTNLSVSLGRRLNASVGVNAHHLVTDGSNVEADLNSSTLAWSTRGSVSLRLLQGLSVQVFGMYRAPTRVEQGRVSSVAMTNIGLRQQLLNNRASLSLRISDPFNTMNFGFETDTELLYQRSRRHRDARSITLSFTYNFGQMQRERRQRAREEDVDDIDFEEVGIQ